jgi:DNA-binding CsgD family transcriptional regulator
MNNHERWAIAGTLCIIFVLVSIDLLKDADQGVAIWHVLVEAGAGLTALFGIFYLLRGAFSLRQRLQREQAEFSAFREEAERWRVESRKYVEGLSKAIDAQLTKWNLTPAEKEVAFLLLKGLGLKEISTIRNTSEKTTRVQSIAIYAKARLAGRSELSAFFLEDLLVPAPNPPVRLG